jgi:6-phosphogluconate dehydrogenase
MRAERVAASQVLGQATTFKGNTDELIAAAGDALYACKVTTYAQGMSLLRMASREYDWGLDLAAIARVWRAGCIIRAALLGDIARAFERDPALPNLLVDKTFAEAVLKRQNSWRNVVQTGVELGIPMPAAGASLAYFDAYRSERLPANLIQAQRDYFGAHTYRRLDKEGAFHTRWETQPIEHT